MNTLQQTLPASYCKHLYWLPPQVWKEFENQAQAKNWKVKVTRVVTCNPLDPHTRLAVVAPSVWDQLCARQGSWYRQSKLCGHYLLVSPESLVGYEQWHTATVTPASFSPPRLATTEDVALLQSTEVYQAQEPAAWRAIEPKESQRFNRWLKKLGLTITFEDLFPYHCANHANFMVPRFFVKENEQVIPYSIAPSTHLCSCCLEIYGIIGADFPTRLVAPCLGAVFFARLPADQYLQVQQKSP